MNKKDKQEYSKWEIKLENELIEYFHQTGKDPVEIHVHPLVLRDLKEKYSSFTMSSYDPVKDTFRGIPMIKSSDLETYKLIKEQNERQG